MTLILKLDPDMVKMYVHTKNEVSMSRGSKVIACTDRNTDRQTDRHTHRQTHTQTETHTDRHGWKYYLPAYAGDKNFVTLYCKLKRPTCPLVRLSSGIRVTMRKVMVPTLRYLQPAVTLEYLNARLLTPEHP